MHWALFFTSQARAACPWLTPQPSRTNLPPSVVRVGVFVDAPAELVFQAIRDCGLNLLQFHGNEKPDYCRQFGLMNMKAFRVRDTESLKALPEYQTEAWLLDAYTPDKPGGTGEKFNWELAVEAQKLRSAGFPCGRTYAGKYRGSGAAGATLWSGCFEWCGIRAGEKGSRESQSVHRNCQNRSARTLTRCFPGG